MPCRRYRLAKFRTFYIKLCWCFQFSPSDIFWVFCCHVTTISCSVRADRGLKAHKKSKHNNFNAKNTIQKTNFRTYVEYTCFLEYFHIFFALPLDPLIRANSCVNWAKIFAILCQGNPSEQPHKSMIHNYHF